VTSVCRHAKRHLTAVGKLDGIPEQIEENLAEPSGVTSHGLRHAGIDIHAQCEALLVRPQRHGVRGVADRIARIEVDRVELEFTCLDPGEVQNVTDDRQQCLQVEAASLNHKPASCRLNVRSCTAGLAEQRRSSRRQSERAMASASVGNLT
jgi:hypothetical protein